MRGGFDEKRTRKGRSAGLSEESAGEGFKPDAAAGPMRKPERDHIRLRGVGCLNIENRSLLRKKARAAGC
jgi:hypothetical protein